MISFNFHNLVGHFSTITSHKLLVMKYCFKMGLYKQGLLHDLSKYSPSEFIPGVKYYQDGKRSPNNAEREAIGISNAWLHHKGRNKHHYEYWIDYSLNISEGLVGMEMPKRYVAEMIADRIAASKIYMKSNYTDNSPWEYYEKGKGFTTIHSNTRKYLEMLLKMLSQNGEEYTLNYIKTEFLKTPKSSHQLNNE